MINHAYSQDEYDRMHNEVCRTPNLSVDELAEAAGVTKQAAKLFFSNQKNKILEAAEKDVQGSRRPRISEASNHTTPGKEEALRALETARKDRDEWERRYKGLKDKFDDVVQRLQYSEGQLDILRGKLENQEHQLEEAAQMVEKAGTLPEGVALKLKLADILLERWDAEHGRTL